MGLAAVTLFALRILSTEIFHHMKDTDQFKWRLGINFFQNKNNKCLNEIKITPSEIVKFPVPTAFRTPTSSLTWETYTSFSQMVMNNLDYSHLPKNEK